MDINCKPNPLKRKGQKKPVSKTTGRRFLSLLDMAIAKHDASVRKARLKRGEAAAGRREAVLVCSCGKEGCMLHVGQNNIGD